MRTEQKWKMLSGEIMNKQEQIKYHVKCINCDTVRILTKHEMQVEECSC